MKEIIVVDDDLSTLDCLRLILSRAGYVVTVYADASPLLNGDFRLPDIFILDKQLKDKDGLDVCRFLKTQESTSNIPVIMISANNLHINSKVKEAGANDFLEKPFRIKELLTMIEDHIQNRPRVLQCL